MSIRKLCNYLVACLIFLVTTFVCNAQEPTQPFRVVAYVPNWIDLSEFSQTIRYEALTHINIAFENPINDEGKLSFNSKNALLIKQAHQHNVKVLISIGGGSAAGNAELKARYQKLLSSDHRKRFAEHLIRYVKEHDFDGLDVDIEGPSITEDYGPFVEELAKAFQPEGKQLTAALSKGYGGARVSDSTLSRFDFVNIMAYDAAGSWNPNAPGQHSSLEFAKSNTEYWIGRGLPKSKAVLGVPFYGYGFGEDFKNGGIGYDTILSKYPGAELVDEIGTTIWHNGIPTIRAKTEYAIDQQLGGIMIWSLDNDVPGDKSLLQAIIDATRTVPVSSLDLSQVTCGWGAIKADRGITGNPLTIRGDVFEHGIGTHSPSKMRIKLNGKGDRFTCVAGVDDSANGKGSVEFAIIADGETLWESGTVQGDSPASPIDLDVRGVDVLELRVDDAGDGSGDDHGDWAEAKFTMQPNAPKPIALPPYETIEIKGKSLAFEFVVADDGRLNQTMIGGSGAEFANSPQDTAYPQGGYGYVFEPALQVVHADGNRSTSLKYVRTERKSHGDIEVVRIHLRDEALPLDVVMCFRIYRDRDLVQQWTEITHHEDGPIVLERMASSSLLLSSDHIRLQHFHGDWYDEMNPISEPLTPGTKILDSNLGVRAHQFRTPSFVLSLDGEPNESSGRVLTGSLAWSGNFQFAFDHQGDRVRALCGVNPNASAYTLLPNETFTTPTMIWVWSENGLGEMSRKFHAWAREHGIRDGDEPRATLLNNWEATGFDFDFDRIVQLYGPAKQMGVELFLLDDGWFGNKHPRINDRAGLGDWEPNRKRFPKGLAPLAQAAVDCGLRFGIWIEPEMVNPKSELYEQHPDWVIRQPNRDLQLQRSQLILDNTRPEVRQHEWAVINGALGVPGVSYAKWDANRYVTQPGSSYLSAQQQTHLWIDYTRHLYDLMKKTAEAFPEVELMLCSGGGGRVDYGALQYFHDFWPSDNTDALRRVRMQWDYSYFFPSIAMCSHVTHSGNRPMHFATSVAMSARFGMDIDVASLSAADRAVCRNAIDSYKQIREVVQLGDMYRVEPPHDAPRCVQNYVTADLSHAVVFIFQLQDETLGPVKPQGLDPNRTYTITETHCVEGRAPLVDEGKTRSGADLMENGIQPSAFQAMQATIVELKSATM
ncbi:Alpha-galactosidase [Planctomycetes bacterium CA13]|uniref:Alpha-galactosidase n=1 Tax=Novipirellula herctigrandis TaxID=2527986 RepID=A0A5C5Z6E2_9BACT|nr:Alpha-galactosidase [Planctomycetes bacterium CA13]